MESLYRRHRFPSEVISHAVWLYHRFALSFRDVEDRADLRGRSIWRPVGKESLAALWPRRRFGVDTTPPYLLRCILL